MNIKYYTLLALFATTLSLSCNQGTPHGAAFRAVSSSQSGIDFKNLITEKESFNIFKYQYFYNGGGVAVGDFNNDGLQDLVFTGNMVKNRLYINKGGLSFEDMTKASGIAEKEGWCTGATPVDINQDGWLDLYICRAGYPFDHLISNLLFINKGPSADGIVRFEEKAAEYGLDDRAHSTQASFFDYDRDGDLDLFLMNHSTVEYSRGSLDIYQIKGKKNPEYTNKLYRNDGGQKFTNVTEAAGLTSNVLSFSLGVSTCDINLDGWADLFVCNDFHEPDYLFINQKNGTFKEELRERIDHTSLFSMGCDIADFNGDGLPDIVTLDMLPESNYLQKMHSGADNFDKVYRMAHEGFFKQYSRNMLQLNNGDGTFSEIGQLAGVSNTDWSWASLFFDFDNDGLRDLFISNGYPRDHTNMDFLKFTSDEVIRIQKNKQSVGFQAYLNKMPPIIEPNYFFKNDGGLTFTNKTADWGMAKPVVTQSAAWADFDNDGDLDLALNNTNEVAQVIENLADKNPENHWLRIKLQGNKANPIGIGCKVTASSGGKTFYIEQNPVRGFQAAVDPVLSLGVGKIAQLDKIVVIWPTGEEQELTNIKTNQTVTLRLADAQKPPTHPQNASMPTLFIQKPDALTFVHRENANNDIKQQQLIPWFFSRQGPALAVGDINGDKLDDMYCGGAKGSTGQVFFQQANGKFALAAQTAFEIDAASEDVDAAFFDADQDGDLDLYVCSGGYEYEPNNPALQDRLYFNDGRGKFTKATTSLPNATQVSTCVRPADIDSDGDIDLFVGGGIVPGRYPETFKSQILRNDGKGSFSQTQTVASANDATWVDINKDGALDVIGVTEWQPVALYINQKGTLLPKSETYLPADLSGLFNNIHAADFDNDGDTDLIIGNIGQNSQLRATISEPLDMWAGDYDRNGSIDPLFFYYVQGKSYPFASMEDMTNQLPYLRKKFNYFEDYANAQVNDILTPEQIKSAVHLQAKHLETMFLENKNGKFQLHPLPIEAQIAPVQAITSADVNADGHLDLILTGNRSNVRVKLGALDGNHAQVFLNDGKGNFAFVPYTISGFNLHGDVRALQSAKIGGKKALIFGINDASAQVWQLRNGK